MRRGALAAAAALIIVSSTVAKAAEDLPVSVRSGGLVRVAYDYPIEAALGFGVIVAKMPGNYDCRSICNYRGATVQGKVGLRGGQLAIGYGSLIGDTRDEGWLVHRVFIGYGVRAALLRRWNDDDLALPEAKTYWGVEGAFTITQFSMTLGIYRPVHPADGLSSLRVFGGIGWGF
jgi:hypothetical protein